MFNHDTDSLEKRLRQWQLALKKDPVLARHVLNRISSGERQGASLKSPVFPVRWALVVAAAAAFLVGAFLISQQMDRSRSQHEGGYYSLIDPVFRLDTAVQEGYISSNPLMEDSLIDRLAWMQDRLDLTEEQFIELVALHELYTDRFNGLYEELARLESRYGGFEELRMRNEMVDFIALYDVLTERRMVQDNSRSLSREFIGQVLVILKVDQRQRYLSLVQKTLTTGDT